MTRYLLDTNHLGETLARVSVVRDRVQRLSRDGDVFGVINHAVCRFKQL